MSKFPDDAVAIASLGRFLNVGNAAVATSTLPMDAAGNTATCIQVLASTAQQIRFGETSAVTCSTATGIALAAGVPMRFKTKGYQFIAAITDTTGTLRVSAVEVG